MGSQGYAHRKARCLLLGKLVEGQITHAKYKSGMRTQGFDGYLYDEDYDDDV
jgi:hypothetical protein